MDIALIAAKVLGVYLTVSGLFLLFRGKTVAHLLRDFFNHPAIMYLSGAFLIFLSVIYLMSGNVWDGTWRTIITVVMWLVLAKGVMYILFPDTIASMAKKITLQSINLFGVIAMAAGIWLYFVG